MIGFDAPQGRNWSRGDPPVSRRPLEGPALLGFPLLRVGGRMRSGNQLPAAGIGDSQIA